MFFRTNQNKIFTKFAAHQAVNTRKVVITYQVVWAKGKSFASLFLERQGPISF